MSGDTNENVLYTPAIAVNGSNGIDSPSAVVQDIAGIQMSTSNTNEVPSPVGSHRSSIVDNDGMDFQQSGASAETFDVRTSAQGLENLTANRIDRTIAATDHSTSGSDIVENQLPAVKVRIIQS